MISSSNAEMNMHVWEGTLPKIIFLELAKLDIKEFYVQIVRKNIHALAITINALAVQRRLQIFSDWQGCS